ncbi:hypothetical protein PJI16_18780 [Nitrospira sp. MA-1]|nr:hypothetical protein [Nitrospira sp. MA-1]
MHDAAWIMALSTTKKRLDSHVRNVFPRVGQYAGDLQVLRIFQQ